MTRGLFDLTGRVVLATGANSGIGLGFLQGCAKQGADVVVWGRRSEKNAAAEKLLQELGAPRTHAEEVDVSDDKAVDAAFASTLKAMGRVDCVFANAGLTSRASSFADMSNAMYHDLLNVNLHVAFYTPGSVRLYADALPADDSLHFHHICMRVADWDQFRARLTRNPTLSCSRAGTKSSASFISTPGRS